MTTVSVTELRRDLPAWLKRVVGTGPA